MKTLFELEKEYDEVCCHIDILLQEIKKSEEKGGNKTELNRQLEIYLNKNMELKQIINSRRK